MTFTKTDSNMLRKASANHLRILIAEDDMTARTILMAILRKWGYEVIAVQDGQAAWQALQRPDCPRLVILDWMMPEMDGVTVIQRVRSELTGQPPYIILLTSKDERGDILSGLESGANDYIRKPFDHEELYARVRVGQRTLELQTSLYETQQTLAHLATHDTLTGIFNRRAILDQLAKELSRAQREAENRPDDKLCIGFFDIDLFKHINDRYGHQAGDEVLCGLSEILGANVRIYDSIGRLGGDEFLVVTPGVQETNRRFIFERLVSVIATSPFKTCAGELFLTISMGVATANLDDSVDQLLDTADAAMYRAKRKGGNCVVYADE